MKKMTTRLLALCMAVLLLATCASAAYHVKQVDQADALNYLGLFLGTGKSYALEAKLNRSQSITLILRMLGEATAAEAGTYKHPFKDVLAWASAYVAYAYEKGYVKGYNATTFGGSDPVTDYQYLTMVLRALGYTDSGENPDFTYRKSAVLARQLGLVSTTADNTTFVRGDAVEIFWNAMSAKLKNSDDTLSDRLISQKVFTKEQFETACDYAENGRPDSPNKTETGKTDDSADNKPDDGNNNNNNNNNGNHNSGEKKAEDYTWEEYLAMTGEERQKHFEMFDSLDAYLEWMDKAEAAYNKEHPTIDVGDGSIDIGDIIKG